MTRGTLTSDVIDSARPSYFYDMFNRTMRDYDPDGAAGSSVHDIEQFMHDGEEMILHGVPNSSNPTNNTWRWMMRGANGFAVIKP